MVCLRDLLLVIVFVWIYDVRVECCNVTPDARCGCWQGRRGYEVTCHNLDLTRIPPLQQATIHSLHLTGNNIETINEDDFRAVSITKLYLSDNRIVNIDNSSFCEMSSSLTYLDLSHNQLTSLPDALKCLHTLSFVNLENNDISTVDVGILINLLSLHTLLLAQNPISMTSFINYSNYTSQAITTLSITVSSSDGGNVVEAVPEHLRVHLQTFIVRNCIETNIDIGGFLPGVTSLILESNNLQLSDINHGTFFGSIKQQLKQLSLAENQLTSFPRYALIGMTSLETLNLARNNITTLASDDLYGLPQLKQLNLEGNNIYRMGFAAIGAQLEFVNLVDNNLSTMRSDAIAWSDLDDGEKTLLLAGNPWLCDCHLKWLMDEATYLARGSESSLVLSEVFSTLTCASPDNLEGKRLIDTYAWCCPFEGSSMCDIIDSWGVRPSPFAD